MGGLPAAAVGLEAALRAPPDRMHPIHFGPTALADGPFLGRASRRGPERRNHRRNVELRLRIGRFCHVFDYMGPDPIKRRPGKPCGWK